MTHSENSFENLSQVFARCGEKVANLALAELQSAINQAVAAHASQADVEAIFEPVRSSITEAKAERRARRIAAKAKKQAKAPADNKPSVAAPASAEAEKPAEAVTSDMVKYLRRCPDNYMLQVLNSYIHLLLTGALVDTSDDPRYLRHFITMARASKIIDNPQPASIDDLTDFFFDNPALPMPRAQRRQFERDLRKLRHRSHN